ERAFQQGCDGGDADGCVELVELYLGWVGGPNHLRENQALLEKVCARDDGGRACNALGDLYRLPGTPFTSRVRTLQAWNRGCFGLEDFFSCARLLDAAQSSEASGAKDPEALHRLMVQGCKARLGWTCEELGLPLPPATASLRQRLAACDDGNPDACGEVAEAYQKGLGLVEDPGATMETGLRACTGGSGLGCLVVARMYDVGGRAVRYPQGVVHFASQACERGEPEGCVLLAKHLEKGRGVAQNVLKAQEARGRACDLLSETLRKQGCQE
ncbi:tetratricopeptide repeat protein, partial [Corallococcus llansteffanensis]